jgi:hypothetical protein
MSTSSPSSPPMHEFLGFSSTSHYQLTTSEEHEGQQGAGARSSGELRLQDPTTPGAQQLFQFRHALLLISRGSAVKILAAAFVVTAHHHTHASSVLRTPICTRVYVASLHTYTHFRTPVLPVSRGSASQFRPASSSANRNPAEALHNFR